MSEPKVPGRQGPNLSPQLGDDAAGFHVDPAPHGPPPFDASDALFRGARHQSPDPLGQAQFEGDVDQPSVNKAQGAEVAPHAGAANREPPMPPSDATVQPIKHYGYASPPTLLPLGWSLTTWKWLGLGGPALVLLLVLIRAMSGSTNHESSNSSNYTPVSSPPDNERPRPTEHLSGRDFNPAETEARPSHVNAAPPPVVAERTAWHGTAVPPGTDVTNHWHSAYQLEAGRRTTVTVASDGRNDLDCWLNATQPTKARVAQDLGPSKGCTMTFVPASTGTYALTVGNFGSSAADFSIEINSAPPEAQAADERVPTRTQVELAPDDESFVDTHGGQDWGNRCWIHLKSGQLGWAEAECRKGIAIADTSAQQPRASLFYNMGLIKKQTGDNDAARTFFERSLALRENASVRAALDSTP